jgi:hypothetical protein
VQVTGLTSVAAIAGGYRHSLAIKGDGTAWAWGDNRYGQLGNGTHTGSSVPVKVSALTGVTAVGGGGESLSLALASAVPPPSVSSIVKMASPFRIIVNGRNLQREVKVYISTFHNGDDPPDWSPIVWKSIRKVVLKDGSIALKDALPKGTPANFTFVNPDGGCAIVSGWSR